MNMSELIIVRGGGDIASGVIQKFHRSGFKVLVLEVEKPSFIRRTVCFGEAIYEKQVTLEGSTATFTTNIKEIKETLEKNEIAVYIDPNCQVLSSLKPLALIDSILAKKNLGTKIDMAPITIGLGPGFYASKDVDLVIETMRGHNLGRLIFSGVASKNTGIPGIINGYGRERVVYSPVSGTIQNIKKIGDFVEKGDIISMINKSPITAPITGFIRGLIKNNYRVSENFKIGDIDPRIEEHKNYTTISDKARTIGGSALEGVLLLRRKMYGR